MEFGYLSTWLPADVMWGDPLTPAVVREIINAADRAAREECANVCDELQQGFIEVGASSVALGALNCRREIRKTITPASRQDDAQSAE
jgi:hypothetical protein